MHTEPDINAEPFAQHAFKIRALREIEVAAAGAAGTIAGMTEIVLRAARLAEAALLGEIALRAKGYWGYDEEFLEACRAELTFGAADIRERRIVVAEVAGTVAGFYSLDGRPPEGELGNMWIEPGVIGTGLGRRLWAHAIEAAAAAGFKELSIEAEPNAEGFYLAMGAERTGETPSGSIPGRVLPLMTYRVEARPATD